MGFVETDIFDKESNIPTVSAMTAEEGVSIALGGEVTPLSHGILKKYFIDIWESSDENGKSLAGYFLGVSCLVEKNIDEAKKYLKGVINLGSMSDETQENKAKAIYLLVCAYLEVGDMIEAEKCLIEFANLPPTSEATQVNKAKACFILGLFYLDGTDHETARKYFASVVSLPSMSDAVQGQKAQALFHLGIMYFNIHNNDIAKGYFEEICKLTSHHITVQEKKVMAYSKLGGMFLQRYSDYENAEKYLLKAVTFDASSDEICIGKMIARYLLGLLHSLLKNTKKARECFEKIIAEPSEHMLVRDLQTEAKKTMEQFGLANKYLVMLDQIRGFLRKIIN